MTRIFAIGLSAVAAFAAALSASTMACADEKPKVDSSRPTPVVYPVDAQRHGEEGVVAVRVQVDGEGKPMGVAVVGSSGYEDLDDAAATTVMNWHFVPGASTDKTTVQVVYKLPGNAGK